jgi:hypothetical protein
MVPIATTEAGSRPSAASVRRALFCRMGYLVGAGAMRLGAWSQGG